jgi:predicted lysophospholipase L1 biosynthesis ABC-type transport system permease subunit
VERVEIRAELEPSFPLAERARLGRLSRQEIITAYLLELGLWSCYASILHEICGAIVYIFVYARIVDIPFCSEDEDHTQAKAVYCANVGNSMQRSRIISWKIMQGLGDG